MAGYKVPARDGDGFAVLSFFTTVNGWGFTVGSEDEVSPGNFLIAVTR